MFYDPRSEPHGLPHNPWLALVVPRPIGWISTLSKDGTPNLAPYSCFNAISGAPPFVMFSSSATKDSVTNARDTGFFTVNIPTYELREAMNISSATSSPDVNEFQRAGLTPEPCRNIPGIRVAESPISIECRTSQILTLQPSDGQPCDTLVTIGEVVGIHIDPRVMRDGRVDVELLQPLSRMGYMEYSVPPRSFEMMRPPATDQA